MTINVDANGRRYAVEVTPRDGAFLVSIDGREREVDVKEAGGVLSLLIGSKSYVVSIAGSTVHVNGVPVEVSIAPLRAIGRRSYGLYLAPADQLFLEHFAKKPGGEISLEILIVDVHER